jgi:hypothetical protein
MPNPHLEKARAALAAAGKAEDEKDVGSYSLLLTIANLQSNLAIATSLDKLAEKFCDPDTAVEVKNKNDDPDENIKRGYI